MLCRVVFVVLHCVLVMGIPVSMVAASSTYSLDLSSVVARERMEDWDPAWISEVEDWFHDFEFQVDPENGGQIGVWPGFGNPAVTPGTGNVDYSQFISAGPPGGAPVRVRMKYQHQNSGVWVSCSHGNDSDNRHHYEVSMQGGQFQIYKFWGPTANDYRSVARVAFTPVSGDIYWIYLTETRIGNSVRGFVTIRGELRDASLNVLKVVQVTDTGSLADQPLIESSNKRGFGGYFPATGTGAKILEWHVEPVVVSVDFPTWQSEAFPPGTSDVTMAHEGDPDNDGLPNLLEYYLGSDPLTADAGLISPRMESDRFIVTYKRKLGRTVKKAHIERSHDVIGEWTADGIESLLGSTDDSEDIGVSFPIGSRDFVRLVVEP